jgi:HD-GYP domain-containing protein (c-di-GMP phosphodiesterase class II)
VADVVEAMVTHRPYRPALSMDEAMAEIEARSGVFYDPDVVTACLRLFRRGGYRFNASLAPNGNDFPLA